MGGACDEMMTGGRHEINCIKPVNDKTDVLLNKDNNSVCVMREDIPLHDACPLVALDIFAEVLKASPNVELRFFASMVMSGLGRVRPAALTSFWLELRHGLLLECFWGRAFSKNFTTNCILPHL